MQARRATPDDMKKMGYGLAASYAGGKTIYKMLKTHVIPPVTPNGASFTYFEGCYYEQQAVALFPLDTFEMLRKNA